MIDRYIDELRASLSSTGARGPFSRVGSTINAAVCAALIGFTVWMGITDTAFAFAVAAVGVALEVVFIRIALRAHRGDFDAR